MPAYRFSWDAFENATVAALADELGHSGGGAREWLEEQVKRPTPEMVRATKDVLVHTWLPNYPGTKHIVDRLLDAGIGPMGSPSTREECVQYIKKCRNSKSLRRYVCEAMLRFGDKDRDPEADTALDFVPRFAILQPTQQGSDERKPHPHQLDAWDKLNAHLAESKSTGVFQGLMVMPTGSGKTYTSVRWLLSEVVSNGGRVLWLAHRHELLSQAGAEFHRLAGVVRGRDRIRVRIVSGAHGATTQIDPADDVVVASVHSLSRRSDVTERLLGDERLFLVVDEAHHAPAKVYRKLIDQVQRRDHWSVLGLTATPTRTIEEERPVLQRLFGGRVIVQVDLGPLIGQKLLARPHPVVVKTNASVEDGITEEDRGHYDRFNDLSEDWLDRIAHMANRNQVVIEHYLDRRVDYGPTLIFAINVHHAALLAEQLRTQGVRAEYVASYRPDGSEGDPAKVIQAFRDGELDVLVNVQMVTEGVDVPGIKTVFLTRPTQSEILMRQMIGRALRGKAAGGSEDAYLVSFEDHWERFGDWESPFDLVPDIAALGPKEPRTEDATEPDIQQLQEHLPWDMIRAVAASMRHLAADLKADAFEAIPDGALVLEREDEGEGIRHHIDVYAHQRPCWDALLDHLDERSAQELDGVTASALFGEFFTDCDAPAPGEHQVGLALQHRLHGGERPSYHSLEGRQKCDPYEVGQRIYDRDLGRSARRQLVEDSYGSLAKAIYPTLRDYNNAIDDALHELEHPEDATRVRRAVPVFEPRPEDQLSPPPDSGDAHNLEELMSEVLELGAKLIKVPSLAYDGTLEWTTRLVKGWYGMAYWSDASRPRIRMNRLLNSPDVTADTVRFLLWHEFLHIHLRQLHTPTFRDYERRWPNIVDADRELDTLNERFGVQYW